MASTTDRRNDISKKDISQYVLGARRRFAQRQAAQDDRVEKAMAEAKQGAELLRRRFGAREVILFGSLAQARHGRKPFTERSDIDLAARGIPPTQHMSALAELLLMGEFPFDLVDLDHVSERMLTRIQSEGVILVGDA